MASGERGFSLGYGFPRFPILDALPRKKREPGAEALLIEPLFQGSKDPCSLQKRIPQGKYEQVP
jgi:hypothetical protein